MAMIVEPSTRADMTVIDDKEIESWNTEESSDRTMPLEEDETMFDDEDVDLSQFAGGFAVRRYDAEEEDEDDIISSCSSSSMDSSDVVEDEGATSRRVKFAPIMVTESLTIMSLSEYTRDEIQASWWTPSERGLLKKAHIRTVQRMEAGLKEKKSAPYRGLEGVASGCHEHMMETRKAYVDTVMGEMERQRNDDSIIDENNKGSLLDWEKIASLTKEITKQSADEAFLIALYDEKEAGVAYLQMAKNDDVNKQSRIMKQPLSPRITKKGRGPLSRKSIEKKKPKRSRLESILTTRTTTTTNIRIISEEGRGLMNVSPAAKTIRRKSSRAGCRLFEPRPR